MPKRAQRITVSFNDEEYSGLMAHAEQEDHSLSWVVRKAVREFLDRAGEVQSQLPLRLDEKANAR